MIGSIFTGETLTDSRRDEKEAETETGAWLSINVGSSLIIAHQYTFQKDHRGIL